MFSRFSLHSRVGPLRTNPARDAFLDCSCNCKTLAHHSIHAYATQTPRDSKGYYQMRPRQAERLCLFIQAIIHNIHRNRAARRWKPPARLLALDEFDTGMTDPVILFDMADNAASAREYAGACDKLHSLVNADLSLLDSPNAPTTLVWQFLGERPAGPHHHSGLYWPPFPEEGGSLAVVEGCRFDFDDLQTHVGRFSHFPIMLSWSHSDMVAVKVEDNPWPEYMRSGGIGIAEK
ncbi:hypothetical protein BJ166DRAFT_490703 [Pestalotiopsis sp. NC0098]|nr:hypothetical protein BJ166DRAFT_490703 [Pestalotiopsis sp. NC0098]